MKRLLALLLAVAVAPGVSSRACVFEGYYAAGAATTQPCPGALPCPPGSYCTNGQRLPCPAGVYGEETALRSAACSAPCPAGFYCPEGSTQPLECGAADRYCPPGSTHPLAVPAGFYALGGERSTRRQSRVAPCTPGSFCANGVTQLCPAGRYGATPQLASHECSGLCPAGSFCPRGSVRPTPCAGGRFGSVSGLETSECSGRCPTGFYCPEGSTSAHTWPCPVDSFCPEGSDAPRAPQAGAHVLTFATPASRELICPVGSYCSPTEAPGSSRLCPAGRFGNVSGLSTALCSGICDPGFFCPRGSSSARQHVCGGVEFFCPAGSAEPQRVAPGFYSVSLSSVTPSSMTPEALAEMEKLTLATRAAQRRCEPGHYCVSGQRYLCPAGRFGNVSGLATPECSGTCAAGFYCPEGSLVAEAQPCFSSVSFCPPASAQPVTTSGGYCAVRAAGDNEQRRVAQRAAQPGEFAWRGSCQRCPAGRFGSQALETRSTCSGSCAAGYYCPEGSTSATQLECGSAAYYCPPGSTQPWSVTSGYYTSYTELAVLPASAEAPGCAPGFYRDVGSTSNAFQDAVTGRNPVSVSYGDQLFPVASCLPCPDGSFKTHAGDDLALCEPCPEFTTRSSNDRRSCICFRLAGGAGFDAAVFALHFNMATRNCELLPRALMAQLGDGVGGNNSVFTRSQQLACERGFFCSLGVRWPCPAGRYGNRELETRSECTGNCAAGHYCPLASVNSSAVVCGGPDVFCPVGSVVPTPVWPGYYFVRLAELPESLTAASSALEASSVAITGERAPKHRQVRDAQRLCEPGSFCRDGEKFPCPAGRYGDHAGETSSLCSGLCQRGYYCPIGSTSPTQRVCGGDEFVCRSGASQPEIVPAGYYSIGVTNATRFFQRPCEPGHFCVLGVKYQCAAGRFGAVSGLATPECSGICTAGYYCPSYPELPSVSSTQVECGNASVFCPEGSGNTPQLVPSGFFSLSDREDDGRNATQSRVEICPKGFFCRRGIRTRCPEGTYGGVEGLSAASCSGWCPAGFFCPFATTDYRVNACKPGTYATRGSSACIACPASTQNRSKVLERFHLQSEESAAALPCTTDRECCWFG